jgi:hypothetical protein
MVTQISRISPESFYQYFRKNNRFFLGRSENYSLRCDIQLCNGTIVDQILDIRNFKTVMFADELRNFCIVNSEYQKTILIDIEQFERIYNVSVEVLLHDNIEQCILQTAKLTLMEKLRRIF